MNFHELQICIFSIMTMLLVIFISWDHPNKSTVHGELQLCMAHVLISIVMVFVLLIFAYAGLINWPFVIYGAITLLFLRSDVMDGVAYLLRALIITWVFVAIGHIVKSYVK